MQKIITTVLTIDNDDDVLRFSFPDGEEADVSLTVEEGNAQLKAVFAKILSFQMKDEVEVLFEQTEGYGNGMYEQACKAYVQMLGKELAPVRSLILQEGFDSTLCKEP